MDTWWSGTWLVLERGLMDSIRSRTFRVVTTVLLLISSAAVIVPSLLDDTTPTYTLATVGPAPDQLAAVLRASGRTGDFEVHFVTRASEDAVRTAVREGDATVGLTPSHLYAAARDTGAFPGVVAQAVVALETTRRLADAGVTADQITALQSIRPPEQVTVAPVVDEGRASVGFGVGAALYIALIFAGSAIATAVAVEKTTRISEVLLSVLGPSQVLTGTVLAVGAVTLLQLLVLGLPVAVAVRTGLDLGIPPVATTDIALGFLWFLLGFTLYAFVYAACGALVQKVVEVSTAVMPIALVMVAGYLLSIFVVMEDPASGGSVLVSMVPFTAPIAMPMRWAGMEVPVWQLVLAMALTATTALVLAAVASRVYHRALLITDRRVKARDLLSSGG